MFRLPKYCKPTVISCDIMPDSDDRSHTCSICQPPTHQTGLTHPLHWNPGSHWEADQGQEEMNNNDKLKNVFVIWGTDSF